VRPDWSSTGLRHAPECLADRSCRTGRKNDSCLTTSLSRVTPPAASEHLMELIGCPISCPSLLLALILNQGPFPPPALPGFNDTTGLSVTPQRPDLPSRASGWSSPTTPRGFPCCVCRPCVHAVATTPAQRRAALLCSIRSVVSAFPDRVAGSACASSFSRFAQRSLALRPAHSRCHRILWHAYSRRLQRLRYLHHCSGSFRREHFAGWAFHPLEQHRLFTAHTLSCHFPNRKVAVQWSTLGR